MNDIYCLGAERRPLSGIAAFRKSSRNSVGTCGAVVGLWGRCGAVVGPLWDFVGPLWGLCGAVVVVCGPCAVVAIL